jgi:hypothetical protein
VDDDQALLQAWCVLPRLARGLRALGDETGWRAADRAAAAIAREAHRLHVNLTEPCPPTPEPTDLVAVVRTLVPLLVRLDEREAAQALLVAVNANLDVDFLIHTLPDIRAWREEDAAKVADQPAEQTLTELVLLTGWLPSLLRHIGDHRTVYDTLRAARDVEAVINRVAVRLDIPPPSGAPLPVDMLVPEPRRAIFVAMLCTSRIDNRLFALRPHLDVDDLRAGLAFSEAIGRVAETRQAA